MAMMKHGGNIAEEQENNFREWMKSQMTPDGFRRYTDNAIIAYCYSIRTGCNQLRSGVKGNLFNVTTAMEYENLYQKIKSSEDFNAVNRDNGNGTFGVALKLYDIYLNSGVITGKEFDEEAPFYLKNNASKSDYMDDKGLDFKYEEVAMTPLQCILYGAPGTGKSYRVRRMIEAEYPDPKDRDSHSKYLIFHPTYTYTDFIGRNKSLGNSEHSLDLFSPGPFTALLKEAFLNPKERYYLVIEEINRGNTPAIFGDLFQLLDRHSTGRSEYSVENVEIATFFSKDPGLKRLFYEGKIWLPSNFNIIGTMNTADENIFVLDNAFKRRFTLEYIRIEFDKVPDILAREYETFSGERPLTSVFAGTPVERYTNQLYMEGKLRRNWPTFARIVNYAIDMLNREALAERRELARIPENKKLGPYFVSEKELKSMEDFINKVIFYLKQDVFTYSDHYLMDAYEDIYLKYMEQGGDLFELLR